MGSLLFEVLPCLLGGMLLGWRWPALPSWLAPLLVRWGVPLSVAALLLRSSLSFSLLKVAIVALLVPLLSLGVLLGVAPFRHRLREPVLILGAAVGNTGYWGLPVALALMPPSAMAAAVVYDVAGTLITWSAGPLILLGAQGGQARPFSTLFASPAMQGLFLALLIQLSPWTDPLASILWWPARAVLVIALGVLGMRLGLILRHRSFPLPPGLPYALAFKLFVIPILVGLLGKALALSALDRQALVLQGAAPTALSVLLMAEANQEAEPVASALVISSTLAAMVTVPLWWGFIQ
ncbi:MAG: AEC family transporter [Cyanobium sp.]|jgi:predicted permease